ncbi:MAG: 1-deoxy-D-xylulose-5-phosphate synthase, partial [Corallococcus sp.]|nr:1-deoxy-D-xylulose-5-phosphate synthase [Corallococcus sp.]
ILASDVIEEFFDNLPDDTDIAAVCAAMKDSVGLNGFASKFPSRFFDVGIAEEHAVTFAAGLCGNGVKPYVLIYSTFLQRAYDEILHDVAIGNLPVTFLIDRAGLVGSDGKTHQGLQDLSYLSNIPNLTIWTPFTAKQLQAMLSASLSFCGPLAIRYPKYLAERDVSFDGKWCIVRKGEHIKILAVGAIAVENALAAATEAESAQIEVVAVTTIKPLDEQYMGSLTGNDIVITVEENQLNGGFGSAVAIYLKGKCNLHCLGVEDKFVPHATVEEQTRYCGIDKNSIKLLLSEILNNA